MPMRSLLALAVAVTVAACAAPEEERLTASNDAIQGGSEGSGDPAVGLLLYEDGGYCTASLIAPNVVLTAAHCVGKPLRAFVTTNGSAVPTVQHAVTDVRRAPFYLDLWCPNPTEDIAVVRLASPIRDIAPLRFGGPPPGEGTTCRVVGFGIHETDDGNTERKRKRTGTSRIDDVSRGGIRVEYATAIADEGDSGGPLLCGGEIVGTVGCHADGDWPRHRSEYYERIDKAAGWIRDAVDDWRDD